LTKKKADTHLRRPSATRVKSAYDFFDPAIFTCDATQG
jgi:hypothetical protein